MVDDWNFVCNSSALRIWYPRLTTTLYSQAKFDSLIVNIVIEAKD